MDIEPKILVLILASDTDKYYCAFQILWRQYMNLYPNIKCVFYKAHPNLSSDYVWYDSNTLLVKMEETFETCYDKLIKVLQYFLPELDNYDYVFRPNLSSFIAFNNYIEFCKTLPKEKCCSAFIGYTDTRMPFPSGAGFTLSIDLVKLLLKDPPKKVCQDDVTIGVFLQNNNIDIIPAPRFDVPFQNYKEYIENLPLEYPNMFHFRLKSPYENRSVDIEQYKMLFNHYYLNQLKE